MNNLTSKETKNLRRQQINSVQQKMHKKRAREFNGIGLFGANILVFIFLLTNGIAQINAVPTDSSTGAARPLLLRRALRDVATMMTASLVQQNELKDITATSTETMLDQLQGQCLLDGVLVAETTVECEKKVGCRAIQKTGHCCPDYKCDCEKDGQTYLNGDKLVDPETPCTVCYCKGGEILCSSAVCFHRDDCTPRYIPGRCCPEYDNCPVTNKTMVSTTIAPKLEAPPVSVPNLNITIKEITKPTEIRITDENKAKPIHQMLKTSTTTTTTTTTTTVAPTTLSSVATDSTVLSSTPSTILTLVKSAEAKTFLEETNSKTKTKVSTEPVTLLKNLASTISQELQNVDREVGNDSSKVNIKREFMYISTEGPVNTSSSESNLDSESSAELLSWIAYPSNLNASLLQTDSDLDPETAGSDNIYHIILSTDGPGDLFASTTDGITVPKLISPTEGFNPEISNEAFLFSNSTEGIIIIGSSTEGALTENNPSTTDSLESIKILDPNIYSTTERNKPTHSHHHIEEEDTALPLESNPAYPSLPEDDFSIRDLSPQISEVEETVESELKDQSRSYADSLQIVKGIEDTGMLDDGSGNGSDLDTQLSSSTSNPRPEKVQFMYSVEDGSSAETTIANSSDFQIEKIMRELGENETGSGDSLEMIAPMEILLDGDFGSGSGSGSISGSGNGSDEVLSMMKLKKEREPTTPRPTQRPPTELDIDELSNASGDGKLEQLEDPKLDAESLKADEKENDSIAQTDAAAPQNDIVSVKLNPKQEKTFEEQQIIVERV